MKKILSPKRPVVHFIGIGGIGMSSLAQWFMTQNWSVSGSDLIQSEITKELRKKGVSIHIGQKSSHVPKHATLVIRSQAVKSENPEFKEATQKHIPVLTYPEIIGSLTKEYKTVAIAGAHGKSTTTALAALALIEAKVNPTVIIGTRLKEFRGNNFRSGTSEWLVLEADEYGKAFLHYTPLLTIITNIDAEHLDTYKNLAGVKKNFLTFIARTREGGALILNKDDKNLVSLKTSILNIARERDLRVVWYSLKDRVTQAIRKTLQIPGDHNVSNALAVSHLADVFHIPKSKVLSVFRTYSGSWRRFEYRGVFHVSGLKSDVFDDYAHHPTEIKATLKGFREKFPDHPIICVFQPHQAERLKRLWPEFEHAFSEADITLLLPIYKVAGRDNSPTRYNSHELVRVIQKKEPKQRIFYIENPKNLRNALKTLCATLPQKNPTLSPVIVMMGAGDIVNYTKKLLRP